MRYWVSLLLRRIPPSTIPLDSKHSQGFQHSAALCQVFDSIYLDVPMSRVKFNVNTEYAYLQNFKILQSTTSPQ